MLFFSTSPPRKPYHTCLKGARFCERGFFADRQSPLFFHDTHKGTVHKEPTPFCEGPRFFGHLSLTGTIQTVYHKFRFRSNVFYASKCQSQRPPSRSPPCASREFVETHKVFWSPEKVCRKTVRSVNIFTHQTHHLPLYPVHHLPL